MKETRRPMASETAAVSEPALEVLTKTSKGWFPPFSLMVTKAFPAVCPRSWYSRAIGAGEASSYHATWGAALSVREQLEQSRGWFR
jgi:hypothetical protein